MYDFENILLKKDDTMEKAIACLNNEALRIVLVVDSERKLLGTITDGDIRRALIHRLGMDVQVSKIMNETPVSVSLNQGKEEILSIMKQKSILQIPLLDANRIVVGLETLQSLTDKKRFDNPVFLMAGGFGTRLLPLTEDVPKPLLKVGDKPILETILGTFIGSGFHNFYISVHYKAEMLREHFGDGSKWGVTINYVHEEEPLGTAGALGLLPTQASDLPVIIMNGDLLTKVNFEHLLQFHNHNRAMATMCVREYDFQVPYGVIEADGHNIKSIVEKPMHHFFVNAGIYVLESELVKTISGKSYLDMTSFLEEQIEKKEQVHMFPIHEYWLDIGNIPDFERANREI